MHLMMRTKMHTKECALIVSSSYNGNLVKIRLTHFEVIFPSVQDQSKLFYTVFEESFFYSSHNTSFKELSELSDFSHAFRNLGKTSKRLS